MGHRECGVKELCACRESMPTNKLAVFAGGACALFSIVVVRLNPRKIKSQTTLTYSAHIFTTTMFHPSYFPMDW